MSVPFLVRIPTDAIFSHIAEYLSTRVCQPRILCAVARFIKSRMREFRCERFPENPGARSPPASSRELQLENTSAPLGTTAGHPKPRQNGVRAKERRWRPLRSRQRLGSVNATYSPE